MEKNIDSQHLSLMILKLEICIFIKYLQLILIHSHVSKTLAYGNVSLSRSPKLSDKYKCWMATGHPREEEGKKQQEPHCSLWQHLLCFFPHRPEICLTVWERKESTIQYTTAGNSPTFKLCRPEPSAPKTSPQHFILSLWKSTFFQGD